VRLSKSSFELPNDDEPLIVVLNHPSWWDPLLGIILSELLPDREHFAAIDVAAIKRYAFFRRLGFVGIDSKSVRGAMDFLRRGQRVLSGRRRALWVTAQGRFTDVRSRPLDLRSGVGHLAARLERGWVLPLAIEYSFWNESRPEALARFGEPIAIADHRDLDGKQWVKLIEGALTDALDDLNAETMFRDPAKFTTLIDGDSGVGGFYDLWRRAKSWIAGQRFDPSHEAVMKVSQ
jgi:1-acyl-sn-glycerol-3-phosphate acyltransferase